MGFVAAGHDLIDWQNNSPHWDFPPPKNQISQLPRIAHSTIGSMMQITADSILKASCLCKQTSVTLRGPPVRSHYCHCTICQNFHGAPFSLNAIYPPARVDLPTNSEQLFQKFTPKEQLE